MIKQGHGLSRADFSVSLSYIYAVVIGPIVIFVLGFISWVFVFWMTGLSLRFCRPACGKWMLSVCIVNRTKHPGREKNLTIAINAFLALGFLMTFLSFIGNAYLDQVCAKRVRRRVGAGAKQATPL